MRQYTAWTVFKSHSDAQTFCQAVGTNLASFVSEDNSNSMIESIRQVGGSDNSYYWTGLKYIKSSGTWSFIDGADTTFAVSKVTPPQNVHSDKCVMIRGDGQLFVTFCTEERRFVCVKY